jgi:hypothetical protein
MAICEPQVGLRLCAIEFSCTSTIKPGRIDAERHCVMIAPASRIFPRNGDSIIAMNRASRRGS